MDNTADAREQIFHNAVREYIIYLLFIITLCIVSYAILNRFKRRAERDDYYSDDEDFIVYRIVLFMSTFSVAVSLGSVLLLPFSIVSNEVLLRYPNSYYVQWLNSSLIHGLWNLVFLSSNLCLFILLPFAYFFSESEGFIGSRKGILGRIYETFIVLSLLAVVVLGLAFVASAIFDHDRWTQRSLLNIRNYYLPWLYSCVSFLGVLLLLISTPWGFARLFTVVGELVVKPKFKMQLDEELSAARLEEADLRRKTANDAAQPTHALDRRKNGAGLRADDEIAERLQQQTLKCEMLERRWKTSPWRRNLAYPVVMLLLLSLTCISVLMVALHSLKLLMDDKALPAVQQINIGDASLSAFGPVGAAVEIILIIYFMLASLVGLYSLPLFSRLRPRVNDTTMTQIIGNCIVLLVLSSALPVLSRCLGITNFDLLGDFGRIDWLGNFRVVLSYNVLFAGATVLCLVTTFTATVRRELYVRLGFEHISRLKHEQWVRLPFNRLHDLGAKSMRSMAATTDLKLD